MTEVTCTSAVRTVKAPVIVCESSGAPSAVAVTVKLNGESSVAEVDVRLANKAGRRVSRA